MSKDDIMCAVTVVLAGVFAGFLMTAPSKSQAATDATLVSRDGKVHLYDAPCKEKSILRRVSPEHYEELRAGTLEWEGKTLEACWVVGDSGMVFLIDSDGDVSRIPVHNLLSVKTL